MFARRRPPPSPRCSPADIDDEEALRLALVAEFADIGAKLVSIAKASEEFAANGVVSPKLARITEPLLRASEEIRTAATLLGTGWDD
jgi:hypothetical protein